MPVSPKRICNRCRQPYKDRCECRPARPETRGKAEQSRRNRAYGRQWKAFRLTYLQSNPLCVDCEGKGRIEPATEVHHKRKLKDAPELQYEGENLMGLCKRCHDVRTRRGE